MAGLFFESGIDKGFEDDLKDLNKGINELANNAEKKGHDIEKAFELHISAAPLQNLKVAAAFLSEEMEGLSRDTEEYKRKASDLSKINAEIAKVKKGFHGVSEEVKTTDKETAKLNNTFSTIGKGLLTYFGASQLMSFGQAIINTRGEFQQLEIAFETMLGGKAKADKLMADVVAFAAKTPYELADVGKGAKQLLAFQVPANEIIGKLRQLGDLAAGAGAPLGDLVAIYGKVKAKGKIQAEEMNQFMERGIPLVKMLAEQFKVSEQAIFEMASEGKIGFKDVEKVINSLTNEGGMFFNLMDKQSKSLTGQVSNMKDAWSQLLNEFGKSEEGVIGGSISGLTRLIADFTAILKSSNEPSVSFLDNLRNWGNVIRDILDPLFLGLLTKAEKLAGVPQKLAKDAADAIQKEKDQIGSLISEKERQAAIDRGIGEAQIEFYEKQQKANEKTPEQLKKIQKEQEKSLRDRKQAYEKSLNEFESFLSSQESLYGEYVANTKDLTDERLKTVEAEYSYLTEKGKDYISFLNKMLETEKDSKKQGIIKREIQTVQTKQVVSKQQDTEKELKEAAEDLDRLAQEYATFEEKKLAINRKYDLITRDLRKAGLTDNEAEAEKARETELTKLDESLVASNEKFKEWLQNSLPKITKEGIKSIQDELSALELKLNAEDLDPEQVLIYKAQIEALLKALRDKGLIEKESVKSWKDTIELMNGVNELVNNISSSVIGLDENTKNALTSVAQAAGGIINTAIAIKALFKAVEEGVSAVQKASLILGVISAAVRVVTAVVGFFKKKKEARKKAEAEETAAVEAELAKQKALYEDFGKTISDMFGSVGDKVVEAFQAMHEGGADAIANLEVAFSDMIENFTNKTIQFAFLQPYLDSLTASTKDLGERYAKKEIDANQLQAGVFDALGTFYDTLKVVQPQILDAYKKADELAKIAGFDSAFNATMDKVVDTPTAPITSVPTPTVSQAGQIAQNITEETGTVVAGRLGALVLNSEKMVNQGFDMLEYAVQNLVYMKQIKLNTDYLPEIAINTRKTYEKLGAT